MKEHPFLKQEKSLYKDVLTIEGNKVSILKDVSEIEEI
jgi:hypothetical protein